MKINGKIIIYSTLILIVLLILFLNLGVISLNSDKSSQITTSETNQNIPEKCQVPSGQNIDSWKEHLGHHTETQDCLKYFD